MLSHYTSVKKNLISINRVMNVGYYIEFKTYPCLIKDQEHKTLITLGKRVCNLYELGTSHHSFVACCKLLHHRRVIAPKARSS